MDAGRRARRPILNSSNDVDRMAIESSRARLMMHLLTKPEESSSAISLPYLRGKSNESARPSVLKQNFLTYPTLVQGLRWSPSIETYSGDSQSDTAESLSVHCNCHKCQMNRRYGREPQTTNINTYSFKENIVRYCDTSTMTRNVKDSGCGVRTPLSSRPDINTSDISISTSDATNVLKILSPKAYTLAPILKKAEFGKETNHRVSINSEDTARHKRSDYEDLLKTLTKEPVTSPLKNNGNSVAQNSRKVLYNEGISNLIIANNDTPNFPFRAKNKSQVKLDSSNRPIVSSKRFGGKNNVIPFTHRTNSKYHYDCKETNRLYKDNVEENVRQLFNISPISPVKKSTRSDRAHLIKLPRRVLTSA